MTPAASGFLYLRRAPKRVGVALCLLVSVTRVGAAASVKLSGGMVAGGGVDVTPGREPLLSPDSRFVVFIADRAVDTAGELWSVRLNGTSAPVRLSGVLPPGASVHTFAISSDSSYVVYLAEQDTPGVVEMYSTPIVVGTPVKRNSILVAGGDVKAFSLVYLADPDIDNVFEVFSVPLDGAGSSTKLNPDLPTGREVTGFAISPDSDRVVYRADQDVDDAYQVYSIPMLGGSATLLSSVLVDGGDIEDFKISGDASWVVYRGDQEVDEVYDVYSAPIGGGTVSKLSSNIARRGEVVVHQCFVEAGGLQGR